MAKDHTQAFIRRMRARHGCTVYAQDCWDCGGEGVTHHDCGEDTCCCLYPEPNVECEICEGTGRLFKCFRCGRVYSKSQLQKHHAVVDG